MLFGDKLHSNQRVEGIPGRVLFSDKVFVNLAVFANLGCQFNSINYRTCVKLTGKFSEEAEKVKNTPQDLIIEVDETNGGYITPDAISFTQSAKRKRVLRQFRFQPTNQIFTPL